MQIDTLKRTFGKPVMQRFRRVVNEQQGLATIVGALVSEFLACLVMSA